MNICQRVAARYISARAPKTGFYVATHQFTIQAAATKASYRRKIAKGALLVLSPREDLIGVFDDMEQDWFPLLWARGAPVGLSSVLDQLVPYLAPVTAQKAEAQVATNMFVEEEEKPPMPDPGNLRKYFRGML